MNECVKRLCTDGSEAGSSKKLKRAEELTSPFAIGGKCEDEVKLVFDDKKELYVSKNFLILSSPVFEAMFRNDFSEKKNNLVKLPGKKYEDFLEFLDYINPGSLQDVDEGNMLRILPIAEEYQVNSAVLICKAIMRNIVLSLKKELLKPNYHSVSSGPYEKQLKSLRRCLNVLSTAICLSYQDFTGQCIGIAACYSSRLYAQTRLDIPESTLHSECKELFERLPVEIRCKILSKRLFSCENTTVYAYSGE